MPNERSDEVLLKQSFDRLQSEFDRFSTDFYEALFRRAPELRHLFREDLAGQGMKFLTTLREIIMHAQDAAGQSERFRELGSYHARIGISAKDFAPMEEALIETLADILGEDFTPELEQAWRRAYADISAKMIGKGGMS
ncbi:globin domain-containing protein [Ruegeria sp. HKCCD8929]|uniref:globin domain-containing protein n=1 Tax=Ruegeria sp. HKCCD8929 TaxID=2683006 RepID=UPI001488AAAB|nr:globin domain-containing protein [Ruegeria sp. HKCCD8929]